MRMHRLRCKYGKLRMYGLRGLRSLRDAWFTPGYKQNSKQLNRADR